MTGNGPPPPPNGPNHYHVGNPPQTQAPPKKKSKTLWIVLGVSGAVVLVCCGFGAVIAGMNGSADDQAGTQNAAQNQPQSQASQDSPSQAAAAPAKQEAPPAPGVGTPVRDGKFEFTVTAVKCGVSKVGGQYLNKSAQGQYCLVSLQVKNIGNEPRTFDSGNQHGFGAGEVKYGTDGVASMYANEDNESFLNEINPGNGVAVDIVFDIPKDGRLLSVRLHDSAFSGGVKVALG